MTAYFIKITIIWSVLLLVYALAFSKATSFRANRLYLLFSLGAGIILPLLPSPWHFVTTGAIEQIITSPYLGYTSADNATAPLLPVNNEDVDWQAIASWGYLSVCGLLLFLSLIEMTRIFRKAIYGQYITINGFRIFETHKPHAPFSFMGWIFITRVNDYDDGELSFLLQHEHAHNQQKHWADIIFVQLCCIIFWINPLVWIFRHFLKLQHEFEADNYAASGNQYDYGYFLLGQVLLKGTPSIAHSFHYSPIKNRITMLTSERKKGYWKYLFLLPAVAVCTMAMNNTKNDFSRKRTGNITTFKGNKFEWTGKGKPVYDSTYVVDPVSGEKAVMVMERQENDRIIKYNDANVLPSNIYVTDLKSKYEKISLDFAVKLKKAVQKEISSIPDSIKSVEIINTVMDEHGKIFYYELAYTLAGSDNNKINSTVLDAAIDAAISKTPAETISLLTQADGQYTFWDYCTRIDF